MYSQFKFENKIAKKLLNSSHKQRTRLYQNTYDQLFRKFPNHVSLIEKEDFSDKEHVCRQIKFVLNFSKPSDIVLEIGPGNCHFGIGLCKFVKTVHAVDVSKIITYYPSYPDNFKLTISGKIPNFLKHIDFAYSDNVIEHIHPDDIHEHFREVARKLKPGGKYIFITPNALFGPHDISSLFSTKVEGLHLKEYQFKEILLLIKPLFSKIQYYYYSEDSKYFRKIPISIVYLLELVIKLVPRFSRIKSRFIFPYNILSEMVFVCEK